MALRGTAGLALLVVALLVVGAYTVLPSALERFVARGVQEDLGLAETPEVELTSDPALAVLLGRFSDGRIFLPPVETGNVRSEAVALDLDPFDVDVLGSVSGGGLRTEAPITGDLRVELSEGEVNRLAASEVTSFPVTSVDLREGSAVVGTEVSVFGFSAPVGVEGGVSVRDGALVFVPSTVGVFGQEVPEDLSTRLLKGVSFSYPLGEQFGGTAVTGVEVLEDRAVLTGKLGELPVGAG